MIRRSTLFTAGSLALIGFALVTTSLTTTDQVNNAVENNRTEEIQRLSKQQPVSDFTIVAEQAIPAVVSIKVQTKKKSAVFGEENPYSEYFDSFGQDFWNFFDIPKRESQRSQPVIGQGSGVIVSPDGYILTNSHVVHDMDSINIQLNDGREFPAKVLGEDSNSDVALIKINATDLPYLTLGNSDMLKVGQNVAAIGNPFGLRATFTTGVVSAKDRNNLDIIPYANFIQTDAAINRGNSGGPLVTLNGEIVGINTAVVAGQSGFGFAVPSNMAKHVMDNILADGKVTRGFLGVTLQSIDYDLAQAFGLKKVEGAIVTNILPNSAAEKAGLKVEDIVIKIDGRPVENAASLRNTVYMIKPGSKTMLTVVRKNQSQEIPLIVGNFSDEKQTTVAVKTPQKHHQLGIEVQNLTPEMARTLGYDQESGVIVTKIQADSPAGIAGIRKGALILAVNRQKVNNIDDFHEALNNVTPDQPILLQMRQGDRHLFLSLRLN